jgi:hypothetical protein
MKIGNPREIRWACWAMSLFVGVILCFTLRGWIWGLGSIVVALLAFVVSIVIAHKLENRRLLSNPAVAAYIDRIAAASLAQRGMKPSLGEVASTPQEDIGQSKAIDLILQCIDPYNIWAVDLEPAIEQLKAEGSRGSDRVASLLRDLLMSRNEGIVYALNVAQQLQHTPALKDSLSAIVAASPVKSGPQGRFAPEIAGVGRIGWTDATHARVTALAKEIRDSPEFPGAIKRRSRTSHAARTSKFAIVQMSRSDPMVVPKLD